MKYEGVEWYGEGRARNTFLIYGDNSLVASIIDQLNLPRFGRSFKHHERKSKHIAPFTIRRFNVEDSHDLKLIKDADYSYELRFVDSHGFSTKIIHYQEPIRFNSEELIHTIIKYHRTIEIMNLGKSIPRIEYPCRFEYRRYLDNHERKEVYARWFNHDITLATDDEHTFRSLITRIKELFHVPIEKRSNRYVIYFEGQCIEEDTINNRVSYPFYITVCSNPLVYLIEKHLFRTFATIGRVCSKCRDEILDTDPECHSCHRSYCSSCIRTQCLNCGHSFDLLELKRYAKRIYQDRCREICKPVIDFVKPHFDTFMAVRTIRVQTILDINRVVYAIRTSGEQSLFEVDESGADLDKLMTFIDLLFNGFRIHFKSTNFKIKQSEVKIVQDRLLERLQEHSDELIRYNPYGYINSNTKFKSILERMIDVNHTSHPEVFDPVEVPGVDMSTFIYSINEVMFNPNNIDSISKLAEIIHYRGLFKETDAGDISVQEYMMYKNWTDEDE